MSDGKKGVPVWVWLVVALPVLIAALGVMSALAIYGVRKYMVNAKQEEARTALVTWADGLARCGQREGRLPPTSTPVPANLSDIKAKKWQSGPADWSEPAYSCAGFSMTGPQYFQYQWESHSPNEGAVRAVADFDGNGVPDAMLGVGVVCNAGACNAGSLLGVDDASRAKPGELSAVPKEKFEPHTPVAGTAGKTLPEPMCAPERVLSRLTVGAEGPTTLRYGLDSAQRPMWMANSQAHPKDVNLFDPQDCAVRGLVGPRRQR